MEINYTVLVFSIKLLALLNGILFMNCNNSKLCIILYFYLFFSFIYIHTTLIELCEYIHCNQYRFFFFQLSVYTYFTFANKNV